MSTDTEGGDAGTSRGRPYRQMEASISIQDTSPRVAWPLRVNRLLGPLPPPASPLPYGAGYREFPGVVAFPRPPPTRQVPGSRGDLGSPSWPSWAAGAPR